MVVMSQQSVLHMLRIILYRIKQLNERQQLAAVMIVAGKTLQTTAPNGASQQQQQQHGFHRS
jgi:hypothetical protein